jgi:hypothetical protein
LLQRRSNRSSGCILKFRKVRAPSKPRIGGHLVCSSGFLGSLALFREDCEVALDTLRFRLR